jgi:hypothetical protein
VFEGTSIGEMTTSMSHTRDRRNTARMTDEVIRGSFIDTASIWALILLLNDSVTIRVAKTQ